MTVLCFGFSPTSVNKPKEKQIYPSTPFDTKAKTFPRGYSGNNIVAIYELLSKAFPPKDEFESTEAYRKRLQAPYPKEFFNFVIGKKFHNFDVNVTTSPNIYIHYDPDTQNMNISINAGDGEGVVIIKDISVPVGKYLGSNKFGVKVVVRKIDSRKYCIRLSNIFRGKEINFKISPEEGRDLKNNLGILFVCKISPHGDPPVYYFSSFNQIEPTIDYPTEINESEFQVNVDIYEIWTFNHRTGTIYSKEIIKSLVKEQ
jgi:hypothetical protein